MTSQTKFGGEWTQLKLSALEAYLKAYLIVMKNQKFYLIYIDAFAGTGCLKNWDNQKDKVESSRLEFGGVDEANEAQDFLNGSVKVALNAGQEDGKSFHEYRFIEKHSRKCEELNNLKNEFPRKKILIRNAEANLEVRRMCEGLGKMDRAVLFLDPFGMQVEWKTIEFIALTERIDLVLLFPVGASLRQMPRDGDLDEATKEKLNQFFGDEKWHNEIYKPASSSFLPFIDSNEQPVSREAGTHKIEGFVRKKLSDIFFGVVDRPLRLVNTKNAPLYLLFFAFGNKKGAEIGKKIANRIIANHSSPNYRKR